MNVVREVSRLESEEVHDMEEEERPRTWPRQKYHFTLIRYLNCPCNVLIVPMAQQGRR